jgi:hypothetical protein
MKLSDYRFIVFLYVGLFLGACATSNRQEALEKTIEAYTRALRVGDEFEVMGFVDSPQREEFQKNSQPLQNLHFSDVSVRKVFPDDELKSALAFINLEYFSQYDGALVSTTRQFQWRYDDKKKAWFLSETTPLGSSQKK